VFLKGEKTAAVNFRHATK